jgi:hypothetical protein
MEDSQVANEIERAATGRAAGLAELAVVDDLDPVVAMWAAVSMAQCRRKGQRAGHFQQSKVDVLSRPLVSPLVRPVAMNGPFIFALA